MKTKRLLSIELLRILLMILIILHHFILHGTGLIIAYAEQVNYSSTLNSKIILLSLTSMAPNCFVFISGFFGIKFDYKRMVRMFILASAYSLGILFIIKLLNIIPLSKYDYIRAILPIPTDIWWFLGVYVLLYLMAPMLNRVIKLAPLKELILGLGGCLVFSNIFGYVFSHNTFGANTGMSIFNVIIIYMLGRLIKERLDYKYVLEQVAGWKFGILFAFTTLLNGSLTLLGWKYVSSQAAVRFLDYRNPLLLTSSLLLFFFIYNSKSNRVHSPILSKVILNVSSTLLGVYLIHEHYLMRELIYNDLLHIKPFGENFSIVYLLLFSLLLLCITSIIEIIRQQIGKILTVLVANTRIYKWYSHLFSHKSPA